ncbi:MAG: enoyl-CoA hydratase [Hyphomicrobiaceae bacterium]
MSDPTVQLTIAEDQVRGPIATITIDNPAKLNSLSSALIIALTKNFEKVSSQLDVRAVILTGAGDRAFVGGADLNELSGLCADSARIFITNLHRACHAIRACPVPVIARIKGYCLGAGLEVAASCDMRAAASTATFAMPEVHLGLPSVIEAALLPGQIGWGRTREMLLTGQSYDARTAFQFGLIQKVAQPETLDAEIDRWIDGICRAAPTAIKAQKALMNKWQEVSVQEGIWAGIDALSTAYATGEPQQNIRAFLAGRAIQKTRPTDT